VEQKAISTAFLFVNDNKRVSEFFSTKNVNPITNTEISNELITKLIWPRLTTATNGVE